MNYLQELSKRTEKAAEENNIEELKKIHKEIVESDSEILKMGMGAEFFYSMLTVEQLELIFKEE